MIILTFHIIIQRKEINIDNNTSDNNQLINYPNKNKNININKNNINKNNKNNYNK